MSGSSSRAAALFGVISAVGLIVGFVAAAFAISSTQDDPGATGRQGNVTLTGIMFAEPYPHIRLAPSDKFPKGRTVSMASANGKRGVQARAREFDGQVVEAKGFIVRRGDGEMLQVSRPIKAVQGAVVLSEAEDLGRWRLSGEICDGQCVLGIMKPGRGLAHKACANLCIAGGVPPLLVTEHPVEGSQFMLLADAEGRALPDDMYDYVGMLLSAEGALERRGNLLVFRIDLDSVEAL